jgi:hypothetical protein
MIFKYICILGYIKMGRFEHEIHKSMQMYFLKVDSCESIIGGHHKPLPINVFIKINFGIGQLCQNQQSS